jgi:hypothetical protein
MIEADTLMITPLLEKLQDLYNAQGTATIDVYRYILQVFVSCFIISFVLFMWLGFLPQVHALHSELQKKRSMLLFLPPQVIRAVPDIRQLVDEILADDVTGIGRAAVRSRGGLSSTGGKGGATSVDQEEEEEEGDEVAVAMDAKGRQGEAVVTVVS